jgi:hypothetical protein
MPIGDGRGHNAGGTILSGRECRARGTGSGGFRGGAEGASRDLESWAGIPPEGSSGEYESFLAQRQQDFSQIDRADSSMHRWEGGIGSTRQIVCGRG